MWKPALLSFLDISCVLWCITDVQDRWNGGATLMETTLPRERLLTVEQVAEILQVHPQTVCGLLRAGQIRAAKVGRAWCGVCAPLWPHPLERPVQRPPAPGPAHFQPAGARRLRRYAGRGDGSGAGQSCGDVFGAGDRPVS